MESLDPHRGLVGDALLIGILKEYKEKDFVQYIYSA